jgi:GntR family transcriptional regulator
VHLQRLRSLGGEPLLLESTDLPAALFPGLETVDLAHRSLYAVLADDYGRIVQTATESLEPVIPTARESALLEVPHHAPAMLIRRISADQSGILVELSSLVLRGDRSRFLLERRIREAWPGAPALDGPREAADAMPDRIAASLLVDA